jgi:hypothetical protein
VKKSGLPQAQAKPLLIRKDSGKARLAVPVFFRSFLPGEYRPVNITQQISPSKYYPLNMRQAPLTTALTTLLKAGAGQASRSS